MTVLKRVRIKTAESMPEMITPSSKQGVISNSPRRDTVSQPSPSLQTVAILDDSDKFKSRSSRRFCTSESLIIRWQGFRVIVILSGSHELFQGISPFRRHSSRVPSQDLLKKSSSLSILTENWELRTYAVGWGVGKKPPCSLTPAATTAARWSYVNLEYLEGTNK